MVLLGITAFSTLREPGPPARHDARPQHETGVTYPQRPLDAGEEADEEVIEFQAVGLPYEHEPRRADRLLGSAGTLGRQPSCSAARRMRAGGSAPTPGRLLTANETAVLDPPARRATWAILGRDGRGGMASA